MPRGWIASRIFEEGRKALQMRVSRDFSSLLFQIPAVCAERKEVSQVRYEMIPGQDHRMMWGRKNEEYIADFCLVSRRYLDDFEYKVFRYHFLLRADWKLCCRQLKLDKGIFFHAVYRIQQKLGRAFRELEPYPLFPTNEYFAPVLKQETRPPRGNVVAMPVNKKGIVRPPLKKAA